MKAAQSVYLTEDRTRAVLRGDKAARFLLVHEGQEIPQATAEQYEGALELIGGTKNAAHAEPAAAVETREPEPKHRDPEPVKHGHKRRG